MKAPRWTVVSPSAYEWEREALEFLREHLPDRDPWRAWSNFEFVDDDGRVNEVDLLVLGPAGLLLVEIKSRPGTIDGDAHSWVWLTDAIAAGAHPGRSSQLAPSPSPTLGYRTRARRGNGWPAPQTGH